MPQAIPAVQDFVQAGAQAALPEPSLEPRHNWQLAEVEALLDAPFNDLIYWAQRAHRHYFDPNAIQLSTLLNIKTGGCPEDCAYCPQSVRYQTGVEAQPVMSVEQVRTAAQAAKDNGATRFCMGAAWRSPKDKDLDHIEALISEVKALGLESCATLGMLTATQADRLQAAGLDFYNHNLDSSESFYQQVISTRTYQDRLDTLGHVQQAGMKVCCGGIVGMGEQLSDRAQLLQTLASFPKHPESVPINALVRVAGTPLDEASPIEPFMLIRTIAAARIMMPASFVRLSAGRTDLSKEQQALCFLAGANSVFYGEQLLTTPNPEADADRALFAELGLHVMGAA